jgi:hypothetical protein
MENNPQPRESIPIEEPELSQAGSDAAAAGSAERADGLRVLSAQPEGLNAMTQMSMPILQIRNSNGGAWCVHAEFPDSSFEDVGGFRTENEANEWIAKDLQQWLEKREKKPNA